MMAYLPKDNRLLPWSFAQSEEGTSAIEFALLLPVFITLYLGTMETSDLLIADRKVTTLASTVGDLVAQDTVITDDEIGDVFEAATAVLAPYDANNVTIVVSSVVGDANGVGRVAWSDGFNAPPRAIDSTPNLPPNLIQAGSSIILTEVSYRYESLTSAWMTDAGFTLADAFYLRPRRTAQVVREP